MTFEEFQYLVRADLYRHDGSRSSREFFRLLCRAPGFRYVFFFRLRAFARSHPLTKIFLYPLLLVYVARLSVRYGIYIPQEASIGAGFYIGHWCGIWMNRDVVIGKNCNISQNVTVGAISKGAARGAPTIGDNVFIGPGAVISGGFTVGNNALIGANSLVISDVPEGGVMIGVPAKLFSRGGSGDFVHYTDYDE